MPGAMDDEASSCTDLTRAFGNAGSSHYGTVETVNRSDENQILTDSRFCQAIERVSEVLPDARPSASPSEVLNGDGLRQSETQELPLRDAQPTPGPSIGASTDVSEHKRKRDQTLGLKSRIDGLKRGLQDLLHPIRNLGRRFRRPTRIQNRSIPSIATGRASHNPYRVVILIESESVGQPRGSGVRSGTLLLDTGSEYNIISSELAGLIFSESDFKSATPSRLANTVGGPIDTLGTVSVRWYIDPERSPNVNCPKKFESGLFHVSAQKLEVDAILGYEDIERLQLVSKHRRLGFVGTISKAPKVDKSSAALVEAAAAERRRAEADQMTMDLTDPQVQQQRSTYAHEQAYSQAQAYANQYRQRHGDQDWMQAYHARYTQVYNQIYYGQHITS